MSQRMGRSVLACLTLHSRSASSLVSQKKKLSDKGPLPKVPPLQSNVIETSTQGSPSH